MAKTLKMISAGSIRIAALYNRCTGREPPQQRAEKQKASSAAQRRMNQIYSYQLLELRLAANFPTAGSALVVTLTYDDQHLPKSRKESQIRFKYFLQKLKKARQQAGLPDPVVFWTPEILTSESGRWHYHIVLDSTGQDLDMIRACWIYGSDIDAEKLRVDDDKNHQALARYMTKELRECQEYAASPGLHGWSCTRNAKKPETETYIVPDDYELQVPEESTVLLDERKQTEYASWRVVKYRIHSWAFPSAARARRRRTRRKR